MNAQNIKKLRQLCRNISVLYVEDDKSVSMQLEKFLRKMFVHVDVEKNGELGLKNFAANRHDIVITDISMPVMDGIEMSRKIKSIKSDQNIIVTSAHNDIEYLLQLIDVGIDKFLLKPVDMNTLLKSMSKIVLHIYREKNERLLEQKIKREKQIQIEMLNAMIFPVAYFREDTLVYANASFKNHFFTSADTEDSKNFRLGYLLGKSEYVSLGNSELIEKMKISSEHTYMVREIGVKTLRRYSINAVELQNSHGCLVTFMNLEHINKEMDRFNMQANYFPKRENFTQKLTEIISQENQGRYALFCIGIKNVNTFVEKYGGSSMHEIYNGFARGLKKEFREELQEGRLFIYLFETNRYIVLVDTASVQEIDKRFAEFGKKHKYEYGSMLPFNLSAAHYDIEDKESAVNIVKAAEGMLYTLE